MKKGSVKPTLRKDYTGEEVGDFVFTKSLNLPSKSGVIWEVRCKHCGLIKHKIHANFVAANKRTLSTFGVEVACHCQSKKKIDYTNRRIGNFICVKPSGKLGPQNRVFWILKCVDCETEIEKYPRNCNGTVCVCKKPEKLPLQGNNITTGFVFGKLKFLNYTGDIKRSQYVGLWECECGRSHLATYDKLFSNKALVSTYVPSCHACRYIKSSARGGSNEFVIGEFSQSFLRSIKPDAKYEGVTRKEWKVSNEYLWHVWQQQGGKCYYSGVKMTLPIKSRDGIHDPFKASLDRKDSLKPYEEGNVVFCTSRINKSKMDIHYEKYIEMCKQIATQHSQQAPYVLTNNSQTPACVLGGVDL